MKRQKSLELNKFEAELSSFKDKTNVPFIRDSDLFKQLNAQKNELNRLKTINYETHNHLNENKSYEEDKKDNLYKNIDILRKLSIRDKIVIMILI